MTPYHFYYVYVLKSIRYAKVYIGYTRDLRKRLFQHNAGESSFTNRFKPWKLVYYEAFLNLNAARTRESSLKHNGNPMRELKKRISLGPDVKVVRGFTLIETLLAVTVLVLSMSGPLTIAAKSFTSAVFAKNQITAFYLAQEAVEYVRNIRDTNALNGRTSTDPSSPSYWLSGLSSCIDTACTVKATGTTLAEAVAPCSGACTPLLYNSATGFYGYDSGEPSLFTRSFMLTRVNDNEYAVTVTIAWKNNAAGSQFVVQENITSWQ